MYTNKKFKIRKALMFFALFVAGIFLFTLIVMNLWNAILPAVIHVSRVSFGQALGILVLSKILFGGFGGGGFRGRRGRMHLQDKFASMTPAERENFKSEWRNRCSPWAKRDSGTTTATTEPAAS